jgi:hypothetical protein
MRSFVDVTTCGALPAHLACSERLTHEIWRQREMLADAKPEATQDCGLLVVALEHQKSPPSSIALTKTKAEH